MKGRVLGRMFAAAVLSGMAFFSATVLYAANPEGLRSKVESSSVGQKVDMFDAIQAGDIEVKLIPKDSRGGNVLITNKTKKPLNIKLPEAFAGVPVLAQFGGIGGGGINNGGGGQGQGGLGAQQALGGGFGGGGGGGGFGGGGGGLGGGGGFFNVGPEKVGKIKITTVCLEHGKIDPSPRVAYTLKPIESFTDKAEVAELCKMVGRGEVSQNTAQAAAWHLANGLTWEQLATKIRAKHLDGSTEPYFVIEEIQTAHRVVVEAVRRGKENPLISSGKHDSLSQK